MTQTCKTASFPLPQTLPRLLKAEVTGVAGVRQDLYSGLKTKLCDIPGSFGECEGADSSLNNRRPQLLVFQVVSASGGLRRWLHDAYSKLLSFSCPLFVRSGAEQENLLL